MTEEILEQIAEYKEAKKQYIDIQEDKMYDMYEITEENGKKETDLSIIKCYISFKSMRGQERCFNTFSHVEALSEENPDELEKMFMEKFLEVTEA